MVLERLAFPLECTIVLGIQCRGNDPDFILSKNLYPALQGTTLLGRLNFLSLFPHLGIWEQGFPDLVGKC